MGRKIIIIVICLLIAGAALSYYFVPAGTWKKIAEKVGIVRAAKVAPADTAHQHGGGVAVTETKTAMETAGQGEEAPTVEIPEDKQELIGVRTVKASVRAMDRVIRTVGRIEYDERKLSTVNAKVEGWIEKLYVDYTGRYVKKGEPLAEIYSPELIATQQEFINTLRWANQGREVKDERTAMLLTKDAQAILEASKARLRLWDISDEQIAKIETTGKPVRTLTIYSPVSGFVVQKMALQGMRLMPGEKLFDVADLSSLWVMADIYEYELPLIKINLGGRLAIPAEAVIDTGERQIVYVDKGEGNFEPREVTPGLQADGWVEIRAGIGAGEKVAASANFLIDSEAQLKGVAPLPQRRK